MVFYPLPALSMTVEYPSLVYKDTEFSVQLTVRNNDGGSVVLNSITVDSEPLVQLDTVPTDCMELSEDENICNEALSFRVPNSTLAGSHPLSITLSTSSRLNFPVLKHFIEVSSGHGVLEIPINVEQPESKTLTSQITVDHIRSSIWLRLGLAFIVSFVLFCLFLLIIYFPEIIEFLRDLV